MAYLMASRYVDRIELSSAPTSRLIARGQPRLQYRPADAGMLT
jgi:hypothetical protein